MKGWILPFQNLPKNLKELLAGSFVVIVSEKESVAVREEEL